MKNHRPFEACDYTEIDGTKYMYLNDDAPVLAYRTSDLTFVAQPLLDKKENEKHNVVPVPLMMTDEWIIVEKHPELVNGIRESSEKIHNYNFIGQCHYVGREVFRELELDGYFFEENPKGIYGLTGQEKEDELIGFMNKIAESRFVFCPRGVGSSSFRLYQSFMVGSVPIITGMSDYPFEDEVNWDEMCIRGNLEDIRVLIGKSKTVDYEKMREKGMQFWDEYCRHDKLYENMKRIVSQKCIQS